MTGMSKRIRKLVDGIARVIKYRVLGHARHYEWGNCEVEVDS